VSETTLASLALLKAYIETEGRDVLGMITPLVEYAGSKSNLGPNFSAIELRAETQERLGLVLPERVIDLILRRMQRREVATRESGRYTVTSWEINTDTIEDTQSQLLRRSSEVADRLSSFVETQYGVTWTSEEIHDALDDYVDVYSIDCIRAHAAASPVPVHGKSPANSRFLVSSFVNELSKSDSIRFDFFVDMVKGRMITNAVLGEDLVDQNQTFRGTILFLDTPLVLRASGLSGSAAERLVMDVVELGSRAGASWGVFEHTLEEADAVLYQVQRKLEYSYDGHGDVYLHAKEAGYSASDVTLLRSQLLTMLQGKGIQLHSTPRYIRRLQVDEVALADECRRAGLLHGNQAALTFDVNSIRSIYVLRKRIRPRKLEKSHAALVTSNSALARGAYAYGRRHEASREVSTVITDYSLANLLWLKWPLQAPEVPKHVLAASCQAALKPSGKLWRAFLGEVNRLEKLGRLSPEQHAFLRFESKVRDELVNLTLGDEGKLDSDIVFRILSAYEEDIARPIREELDGEKDRRVEVEQTLLDSQLAGVQLRRQLARERARRTRLSRSIAWWARIAGRTVLYLCFTVGVTLIATGLVWLLPENGDWGRKLPPGIVVFSGFATVVLSLLNLTLGVTLRTPLAYLSSWVERQVYSSLSSRFEVAPDTEEISD